MTSYLRKSCSVGLLCVFIVNVHQFLCISFVIRLCGARLGLPILIFVSRICSKTYFLALNGSLNVVIKACCLFTLEHVCLLSEK